MDLIRLYLLQVSLTVLPLYCRLHPDTLFHKDICSLVDSIHFARQPRRCLRRSSEIESCTNTLHLISDTALNLSNRAPSVRLTLLFVLVLAEGRSTTKEERVQRMKDFHKSRNSSCEEEEINASFRPSRSKLKKRMRLARKLHMFLSTVPRLFISSLFQGLLRHTCLSSSRFLIGTTAQERVEIFL